LAVAVIVKVVVTGTPGDKLFNVPLIVLPVPLSGIPVSTAVLSRVQEYVVPGVPLALERSI